MCLRTALDTAILLGNERDFSLLEFKFQNKIAKSLITRFYYLNISKIFSTNDDTLESKLLCIFRGFEEVSKSSKLGLFFKSNYLKSGNKNVFVLTIYQTMI